MGDIARHDPQQPSLYDGDNFPTAHVRSRRTVARRRGGSLACVVALVVLCGLTSVGALARPLGVAAARSAAAAHPSYVLHGAKGRCKSKYKKQTVTVHKIKDHQKLTVHQVRCVWAGGGASGGGSTTGSAGSGGAGGSSGSGGSGGGSSSGSSGPPVAVADSYSVALGSTLTVGGSGVLGNDRGSGLTANLLGGAGNGSLTFNHDGSFSYTPHAGFSGVDTFTYKDTDKSSNSSNAATVTITVTPLAHDDSYDASSGSQLSVSAPGLVANDGGNGLSASVVSGPAHGTLVLSHDGAFTYTSTNGFTGNDSFTYKDTDGAGSTSNTATVTIAVGAPAPPSVIPESYTGAVGNTPVQVGDGSRQSGPELYFSGASALDGDSDPGGGTLSTTPATIATEQGGSAVMNASGGFIYTPPVGFVGPSDSFSYQVDASEGTTSEATATIDFSGARVWYVNAAAGSGGDGSAGSPLDSLSALSGVSTSAGDTIYLYRNAAPYSGGITLGANQTLVGSSAALTDGTNTLLAASGGANPTITNSAGAGVTVAEGDTLDGVTVSGTSGDGISATTAVDTLTIDPSVSVLNSGGDGLDIDGGSGTISDGAAVSGSTGHSVDIAGRTGGTVTVAGTIDDSGTGVLLTDNTGATINFTGAITASTGSSPAFTATGGGTVTATNAANTLTTTTGIAIDVQNTSIGADGLTFQAVSAGTGSGGPADGILIDNAGNAGGLTVTGTGSAGTGGVIEGTTAAGATDGGVSVSDSGAVALSDMEISSSAANGVSVFDSGGVTLNNVAVSGSVGDGLITADAPWLTVTGSTFSDNAGRGIYDTESGALTSSFDIENNTLVGQIGTAIDLAFAGDSSGTVATSGIGTSAAGSGSADGSGLDISDSAGTVNATIYENPVQSIAQGNGISGEATGTGTLNMALQGNTVTMNGSGSQDGMAFASESAASSMCLDAGSNTSDAAAGSGELGTTAYGMSVSEGTPTSVFEIDGVGATAPATYLAGANTLTGASGGQAALAVANSTGFGDCSPPGGSSS